MGVLFLFTVFCADNLLPSIHTHCALPEGCQFGHYRKIASLAEGTLNL